MKYDFTKVQRLMAETGMTLAELAERINEQVDDPIHVSTLGKAFQRGTASQRTAKAISTTLQIPLKQMLRRTA